MANPGEGFADQFRAGVVAYDNGLYEQAARIWRRVARRTGDPAAQHNLALLHERGLGMEQNFGQAARYYLSAARQDYAPAQYNLAGLYHRGEGTVQNDREAIYWWSKAAQQGYKQAQYVLGALLLKGELVPKNREDGIQWLEIAAREGHSESARLLDRIRDARLDSADIEPPDASSADTPALASNAAWILQRAPSNFTVELYRAGSPQEAESFITRHGIRTVATFYQRTDGRFVVIGGAYKERKHARMAIANLTSQLRTLEPRIRTFASVHNEIDHRGRDTN